MHTATYNLKTSITRKTSERCSHVQYIFDLRSCMKEKFTIFVIKVTLRGAFHVHEKSDTHFFG